MHIYRETVAVHKKDQTFEYNYCSRMREGGGGWGRNGASVIDMIATDRKRSSHTVA